MARSSYIYLVVDSGREGVTPIAAFTVKHECLAWLKRARERASGPGSWEVLRFRDGHADASAIQNWQQLEGV